MTAEAKDRRWRSWLPERLNEDPRLVDLRSAAVDGDPAAMRRWARTLASLRGEFLGNYGLSS